jgi:glycosyltransferase involved in cell wall biosynthesis
MSNWPNSQGHAMKILMVTDFYPPILGGVERAVADLSAELNKHGHDVAVATLWHEGMPHREHDGAVVVHRLQGAAQRLPFLFTHSHRRFHPPVPDPVLTRQLRSLIVRDRPDVVHGHTWMMLSALPLRREYPFATVATLHDYALLCPKKTLLYQEQDACPHQLSRHCVGCASQRYGGAKGLLTAAGLHIGRREYREVDAFVAISDYVAAAHTRDLTAVRSHIWTIPNFVRSEVLHAATGPRLPGLPDEYILFVGALRHHKGIHVLLKAYARLGSSLPLVLIGTVWPETPTTFPPGVIMQSDVPHADVIRAMDHCRFLVSPALWPEPFGLVAIEAMARAKAVVASRTGGMVDIVQDGETGLLVSPGDVEDLAAAMHVLIDDRGRTERMGRAGAARCAGHFVADAVVPRIIGVYRDARVRALSLARIESCERSRKRG